jgi:hypothetical protein
VFGRTLTDPDQAQRSKSSPRFDQKDKQPSLPRRSQVSSRPATLARRPSVVAGWLATAGIPRVPPRAGGICSTLFASPPPVSARSRTDWAGPPPVCCSLPLLLFGGAGWTPTRLPARPTIEIRLLPGSSGGIGAYLLPAARTAHPTSHTPPPPPTPDAPQGLHPIPEPGAAAAAAAAAAAKPSQAKPSEGCRPAARRAGA